MVLEAKYILHGSIYVSARIDIDSRNSKRLLTAKEDETNMLTTVSPETAINR